MKVVRNCLALTVFGAALAVANVAPASAQGAPASGASAQTASVSADFEASAQRRGWGGRGGWHGGRHWGGGPRYYGRRGWGGAGIGLGLATGALIGGALAAQPRYYAAPQYYYDEPAVGGDAVAYCMNRFKSYDPRSGTYLGYDGLRHPCP